MNNTTSNLMNALQNKIDTTKLTTEEFCAITEAAVFYAKMHTPEQAVTLAIEEVLQTN